MINFKLWLESVVLPAYHVTYYKNLDSISDIGLDFNEFGGANFERPHLQQHSQTGNFFTTNISGVSYWIEVLEYQAYSKSDDIERDELIPIILKFNLNRTKQTSDRFGETPYDRKTERIIQPQGIQVWDGKKWLPIVDWGLIDLRNFLDWDDENNPFIKENYPMPTN